MIFQGDQPAWLAMLCGLALGAGLGALMGSLTVTQGMPAFIVTLGGMLLFRGVFLAVIRNSTVPIKVGGVENAISRLTTYYLPPAAGIGVAVIIWLGMTFAAWCGRSARLRHRLPAPSIARLALLSTGVAALLAVFVAITANYRGVPLASLVFGLVLLGTHLLVKHTPWGRHLVAIGGNEEAARLSGVPVRRTVILAFAGTGFIAALTGFLQTAYVGSSTPNIGEWMELDAVAACVIGGVSLKGGRGSVAGVLFGALIMAVLLNGMTLMAVDPQVKMIARGVVLVAAVWLDVRWRGRGATG
jgi:D-xylose transport system permease protein